MNSGGQMTLKRINREIADLKKEDLGSIVLEPTEENMHVWRGTIPGPEGSVYDGGVFHVEINLPADYPFSAPRVSFKTRIYHMNISENGSICIDILKTNWSPALSLFKVMLSISSLLTDPNPRDPLVPTIANQYTRNRKQHDSTAREWTTLYAKPKPSLSLGPVPAAQPSASTSVTPPQQISAPGSPGGRGGRRNIASTRNARAGTSSAGSQASTPVIVIDDEDEVTAGSSSAANSRAANTRGKRKREGQIQGSAEVVDLSAEDDASGSNASGSAAKRQRTARNSNDDDVIVIEDD
ncbi:hypothetical protein NP233_g149 [Leucocoprinus birnbaumii]|uniref:E2 ubiquitin-conjugating enzyme n=1 Tax=Leucocoprinus birnbaumii TaxID=56174 RepID=A0AAD5W4E7_9AGAR|nr:hypothetical protein NP233_g149 [Leucocoprinus birnbaumii]